MAFALGSAAEKSAKKALNSLLSKVKSDEKLQNDKHIQVVINLRKPIPLKDDHIPRVIPLKHRMNKTSDLKILLITKDPSTLYRKTLSEDPLTEDLFKDIISVKRLKSYKGKKLSLLFKEFDIVVADHRVQHLLPGILGATFYHSHKKLPFKVQMTQKDLSSGKKQYNEKGKKIIEEDCDAAFVKAQLRSICKNTFYVPNNKDNCLSVRLAGVDTNSVDEMTDNLNSIVCFLTDKKYLNVDGGCIRNGIDGIESIFIKTGNSIALPVYKKTEAEDEDDEEIKL